MRSISKLDALSINGGILKLNNQYPDCSSYPAGEQCGSVPCPGYPGAYACANYMDTCVSTDCTSDKK